VISLRFFPKSEARLQRRDEPSFEGVSGRTTMAIHSGAAWSKQDLFFLKDSLQQGWSFVEVASFLRKDERDVRKKAKDLERTGRQGRKPHRPTSA
jgi:hypothetical protein